MNRAQLLRSSVTGGALLATGGAFAAVANAAPPATDLVPLRLVIATELLKLDFATNALASEQADGATTALLKQMHADDTAHYDGLASLFTGAGGTPATADDIDFAYPSGTFASAKSISTAVWEMTTNSLGAYLGALANLQTPRFKLALAQIAANEAQQVSAAGALTGKPTVGSAFAPALNADEVTTFLDVYES